MTENMNIMNMPFEDILAKLRVKNNKNIEFYVFPDFKLVLDNGKIKRKHWDIYVCKTDCSEEEIRCGFCYALKKTLVNTYSSLIDLACTMYDTTCISEHELKLLELINITYRGMLQNYTKDDLKRYEQNIFTKYVYGTTSIEGNTYTLQETNLTLNEGLTVSGKEKREFYEIENYGRLQEYVLEKRYIDINEKLIKRIYKIIMQNIYDDSAGCFRRIDVGITGTQFVPTTYLEIEEEISSLINWYNVNLSKLHPVELASGLHQKFEQIHPFKDGNGRVGRELVRIILRNNHYPTIFIDNKNREEYITALEKGSNDNSYHEMCKFIVGNLIEVHEVLLKNARNELSREIEEFIGFCGTCSKKKKCNEIFDKLSQL